MQITPDLLIHAYAAGVFPMAESRDAGELFWVDPEERGILPLDKFLPSRSLIKEVRKETFCVRYNTDFAGVLQGCAAPDIDREDTWINEEIFDLFNKLHAMGHAHSVECWQGDVLVGGLYGLAINGLFCGESMFSRAKNASKVALCYLVFSMVHAGFKLLDVQFTTQHLCSLGAIEISRADYHTRLNKALDSYCDFPASAPCSSDVSDWLKQRRTQISCTG